MPRAHHLLLALCLTSTAAASPGEWASRINAIALQLTGNADVQRLPDAFAADGTIRQFGKERAEAPSWLSLRLSDCELVADLAYTSAPQSLATDMAQAVASLDLPPAMLAQFTIDANKAAAANATAREWVTRALALKPNESAGVVLLVQTIKEPNRNAVRRELILVLLAGDAASGKISRVLYGTPEQALRSN